LTIKELQTKTGIPQKLIEEHMKMLTDSKNPVLQKASESNKDQYEINASFMPTIKQIVTYK